MRIFKQKKAVMAEVVYWLVRITCLIFIIGVLVSLKAATVTKLTKTNNLEYNILINRLIYSPAALAYFDPDIKRAYPGEVDFQKFDEEYLNNALKNAYKVIALRLYLVSIGSNSISKEIYYDRESYDMMKPLVGYERFFSINETRYVLIKKDNERIPGLLNVELISGERIWE